MVTGKHKQILIAPLDWGLGHTTRCVPIIRYVQSLGHVPVIACNESQRSFIEETFGAIEIIHLNGYNISYSGLNRWAQLGVLAQLPRIQRTIRDEHNWLQQIATQWQIDGIISDNRYGLWHPHIPSVVVTHQLMVQTGMGSFADRAIQKLHYKYLNRFNEVWVPDAPEAPGLANALSHPPHRPHSTHYIGLLSRFTADRQPPTANYLLILLSGPEPQRAALSGMLWTQLQRYDGKVVFVDGSENAVTPAQIPSHITYYKRLAGAALETILRDASMVICRSGYSTLMDLVALNKKAILIPTPGQTEQQYLARMLQEAGVFPTYRQSRFQLHTALSNAGAFPFHSVPAYRSFDGHKGVLDKWIKTL